MTTQIPIRTLARITYDAMVAASDDPEGFYGFDEDPTPEEDPTFDREVFIRLSEDEVRSCLDNSNATPEQIHVLKRAVLEADGWVFADEIDLKGKKHPNIRDWEDLPEEDQKDYRILVAVVRAAMKGEA